MTIERAELADRELLANLLQLYYYDFSEFTDDADAHIDATGRFPAYPNLDDYLRLDSHGAFIVRADGRVAGFALVDRLDRGGTEPSWGMREFFVLRHERRAGVGRAAATALFTRCPGRWEVGELHANHGAIAFWRRVIGAYTGGRFSEEGADDPGSPGPLQIFRTPHQDA